MIGAEAFDGFKAIKKDGTKLRAMIVDDSTFMIKQLERFLTAIDVDVVATATNGLDAVKLYPVAKPDFVTLDITMPKMDGMEALTEIKKLDKKANIIMVSALGQEQTIKESILRGAIYFLVKPITITTIRERLIPVLKKLLS